MGEGIDKRTLPTMLAAMTTTLADPHFAQSAAYFRDLQDRICAALAEARRHERVPRGRLGARRAAAAAARASSPTAASSRRPASTSPRSTARCPRSSPSRCPARAATSPPPASRSCCTRAARMVPTVHANFRFLTKGERAVVRRRRRPDAVLPLPRGRRPLPPHLEAGVCTRHAAAGRLRRASRSGATTTSSCRTAASRAASAASSSTTSKATSKRCSPSCATRRRLPRRVPADRPPAQGRAVHRASSGLPGVPPRPLRRVQPALRPRHDLRPEDRRPHRVDPDVAAAASSAGCTTTTPSPARARRSCTSYLKPRDWADR